MIELSYRWLSPIGFTISSIQMREDQIALWLMERFAQTPNEPVMITKIIRLPHV